MDDERGLGRRRSCPVPVLALELLVATEIVCLKLLSTDAWL